MAKNNSAEFNKGLTGGNNNRESAYQNQPTPDDIGGILNGAINEKPNESMMPQPPMPMKAAIGEDEVRKDMENLRNQSSTELHWHVVACQMKLQTR